MRIIEAFGTFWQFLAIFAFLAELDNSKHFEPYFFLALFGLFRPCGLEKAQRPKWLAFCGISKHFPSNGQIKKNHSTLMAGTYVTLILNQKRSCNNIIDKTIRPDQFDDNDVCAIFTHQTLALQWSSNCRTSGTDRQPNETQRRFIAFWKWKPLVVVTPNTPKLLDFWIIKPY